MTHYLRFTDEATFQTAAEAAGLYSPYVPAVPATTDEEPEQPEQPAYYTCYTHDHSMDIIGVIYNDDGVYDDEGEVVTPPTPMVGWHVNFKGTLPEGWDTNVVTPSTPYRIFAGD